MTTTVNENYQALRDWMVERDITFRDIAERLQMTRSACNNLLRRGTIPTKRFNALLGLGFPPEILPEPFDYKMVRPIKTPRFPADQA